MSIHATFPSRDLGILGCCARSCPPPSLPPPPAHMAWRLITCRAAARSQHRAAQTAEGHTCNGQECSHRLREAFRDGDVLVVPHVCCRHQPPIGSPRPPRLLCVLRAVLRGTVTGRQADDGGILQHDPLTGLGDESAQHLGGVVHAVLCVLCCVGYATNFTASGCAVSRKESAPHCPQEAAQSCGWKTLCKWAPVPSPAGVTMSPLRLCLHSAMIMHVQLCLHSITIMQPARIGLPSAAETRRTLALDVRP